MSVAVVEQWQAEVAEGAEAGLTHESGAFGEVVEPELVKPNLHCPNCGSETRQVIVVGRKGVSYQPTMQPVDLVGSEPDPGQLVGCFSCLNFFACSVFHVISGVYNAAPMYDEPSRGRSWLGYNGVLIEILKSIVYVGLTEVIASTSVVSFAAAFDANISSIIALAVASLIGGIFFIGHNLWDLRDDCYAEYLSQETNEQASNKYKKLLGQINHFPLHVFFAILSFVAFGMIPPIAYVLSFHETNDKNSTLLMVAIVSLLCILMLAIFKACINCSAFQFIKTAVYYATIVVIISSVSYVAGNLFTRLMMEFGLFETSSYGVMSLLSHVTTSSLAIY
ncbi:hypothetical protein E3N88_21985 [Mikania micrantha]|uniref:Uncharacterized protein n=1 Tax=Mikania micrantha TaxID=192012 RepID=A0A5N6N9H2_9ASTR|nr:hypothetical protein E3N88_21985 [Mikania micrantha]